MAMSAAASDALDALFADKPETLTVAEVSTLLRKTTTGVYGMCRAGKLPAYQVAGHWLILRDALKEQMRQGASIGQADEEEEPQE
jgi:excisionase family DNA binding protein